jgi:MoaA/NifB/PqqE/SkfB family radical SAM enzyme
MSNKVNLDSISWNITNYCLSNCKYCQLWNGERWDIDNELTLSEIEKNFLSDPAVKGLKTLHITGGSPYLSPRFIGITKLVGQYLPNVPVNSPIEGLFPRLYERVFTRVLKYLPQYRVDLALEGADKETHEKMRPGSWESLWDTKRRLTDLGMKLQFEMSIYPENYKQIEDVWALADGKLYINFGRYSYRFGNQKDGIMHQSEEFVEAVEDQLKKIGWLKLRPWNQQKWDLQKAMWQGKKVRWDCQYGLKAVDVDPIGQVYPCLMYPGKPSGSLKRSSLSTILSSRSHDYNLHKVKRKVCQDKPGNCPFTCGLYFENIRVE